jgi:hypothetical protein
MDQPAARRCAIWVDTATFMAAQELAEVSGIDIDTLIEAMVKGLHAQAREVLRRTSAEEPASAPVIPITEERRRRRRRSG